MKKELLKFSFDNKLSHIPSALSMIDYVQVLFEEEIVKPYRDHIIIGKPFGAQTYYLLWKKLGFLTNIETLSVGVKHDEIDFVKYGEETMGNALGVAIGVALAEPDKRVWVNLSDATLQMGNLLEALQFIGHHRLKNILVTVDYNNSQVTGSINDILSVDPVIDLCKGYGWNVQEPNGHELLNIKEAYNKIDNSLPNIVFFKTIKGHGFRSMIKDIKKWHYKKIETLEELQSLVEELQDI